MGCSVAYHLSAVGETDVVLLEQGRLTSGTTWHAAGLVGQLRAHESMTRLIRYSTELYSKLEAETGLGHRLEAMRLAGRRPHRGPDDSTEAHRGSGPRARRRLRRDLCGRGGELYPIMATEDLKGGGVVSRRRQGESRGLDARARKRCAQSRRQDLRRRARSGGIARLRLPDACSEFRLWRGGTSPATRAKSTPRSSYLRRPVVARLRAPDRRHGAAFLLRALLHRHRSDRRRASRSAGNT